MTRPTRPGDWVEQAACAGYPADWFYPEPYQLPDSRALTLCKSCPVRRPCLAYALTARELGVWGGLSERERHPRPRPKKVAA